MSVMATFFIFARNDSKNMLSIILSIKDEIKDFHGRLCITEERKKMEENRK
jgi:hypothetical protein